jgi:anti-sigma regulatory factor (Ser/Thr protein kinase)
VTAPNAAWAPQYAHSMLCYDTDASLVEAVVEHGARMLLDGGAVMVIATRDHGVAIETRLEDDGFDVAALAAEGRLVVLDAVATRAALIPGDAPVEASVLDAVVGNVLRSSATRWGKLLVFGEMVALLWADGLVNHAIDLEALWSDLADEVGFEVFCAYPVAAGLDDDGSAFERVCSLHNITSGFRGAARHSALRRFDALPTSIGEARRFVADTLAGSVDDEQLQVAVLVASELAANAFLHARTTFLVAVERIGDVVRVSVADGVPVRPTTRVADGSALSGRGLRLVEALSRRWGSDDCGGGKVVWADVATGAPPGHRPVHGA